MKSKVGLNTLDKIIEDIIENMGEADKANVIETSEDDLIRFHHGWGAGIRNHLNLWHDKALLKEIGEEHPDDASMVIIKAVWKTLRESGETFRKGKIETDLLEWEENKKTLEIKAGGRSIVIEGIDYEFAEEFANALRLGLYSSKRHTIPEVAPQVILQKKRVTVKVWKYPAHPDNN